MGCTNTFRVSDEKRRCGHDEDMHPDDGGCLGEVRVTIPKLDDTGREIGRESEEMDCGCPGYQGDGSEDEDDPDDDYEVG